MNKKCVVLIISHKEVLSELEYKSIQQCMRILLFYEIILITKKSNSLEFYKSKFDKISFYIVDDLFLNSYEAFNQFKLNRSLYLKFIQFEYILFFEPDAWVFKDEILRWCNAGYDYIGAPWFSSMTVCDPNAHMVGGGNGGFSLRNTRKHYMVLRRVAQLRLLNRKKLKLQKLFPYNQLILRFNFYFKIAHFWELPYILEEAYGQEDVFLSYRVASTFSDFNVAPVEEALKFSFEVNPSVLYEKNERQLPFGCHAYQKYQPDFWKQFIPLDKET